jgi:competence protein ComEC
MRENNKFLNLAALTLIAANIFVWNAILFGGNAENLELWFLDVGQGDSELVNLPGGAQILIDGGPSNGKVLNELARAMKPTDRYLDILVVSHPQLDHFAGLIDVLKNYQVGAVIDNGRKGTAKAYADFEKALAESGARHIILAEGDAIKYGEARFDILSPNRTNLASEELNDTTLVMLLEDRGLRALYTGDIGQNIEDELIRRHDLFTDVLKVGHHGSRFSSSPEWLRAVRPKISVIEVGAQNTYGHPTKQALGNLADVGAQIFRTDRDGTIKMIFDGERLKVYNQNQF